MTDVDQRIQCRWCHEQSPVAARTCDHCGAPLDVRDVVTDSGWREAPRLRDLTELHWSASTLQLDTGVVPVVEILLAAQDHVFFEHYAMLWKDETVPMSVMPSPGGSRRLFAGVPFVLSVARGPGKIAFSRDAAGELVVLPIEPPAQVDVREHAMVLASGTLSYSFEKLPGVRAMLASGSGMYMDRFMAQAAPGLLVLHGYGNVFQRSLAEGETILIEPGAFLYKDSTVAMETTSVNFKGMPSAAGQAPSAEAGTGEAGLGGPGGQAAPAEAAPAPEPKKGGLFGRLKSATSAINVGGLAAAAGGLRSGGIAGALSGLAGGGGSTVLRMKGPGRIGIQSMFKPHETD
ncbi:MAG TPA: AIM24 family protein [Acidimicrobiales bacterium]|nr:AIM24 family protein [Acidimicrobiales bacterium]